MDAIHPNGLGLNKPDAEYLVSVIARDEGDFMAVLSAAHAWIVREAPDYVAQSNPTPDQRTRIRQWSKESGNLVGLLIGPYAKRIKASASWR